MAETRDTSDELTSRVSIPVCAKARSPIQFEDFPTVALINESISEI